MTSDFQCQSSLPSEVESGPDNSYEQKFERALSGTFSYKPRSQTTNSALNDLSNLLDTREKSSGRQSRASSNKSLSIAPFGFEAKTSYDASDNLTQTRSRNFTTRSVPVDNDVWKRPPPDFRPQVYAPKPPKRNSREAVQPWRYTALCDQNPYVKKNRKVFLPHILKLGPEEIEEEPFETRFHVMDPFEARVDFVLNGMYPAGRYSTPTPHDHRGLQPIHLLGLSEFTTASDHDPFNIRFHSRNLNTIHGLSTAPPLDRGGGLQMAPPLHLPPRWENRLILPKDPWPQRNCAYTRYRSRSRTAHSALMERIDDKLSAQWAKEKLDSAIKSKCSS